MKNVKLLFAIAILVAIAVSSLSQAAITSSDWLTDNPNKDSSSCKGLSQTNRNYDRALYEMKFRGQPGYGIVNAKNHYAEYDKPNYEEPNGDWYDFSDPYNNNDNGSYDYWIELPYTDNFSRVYIQGYEQSGYGLVNMRFRVLKNNGGYVYSDWSNNNYAGTRRTAGCPHHYYAYGGCERTQNGYGIIDFKLLCSNDSGF